MCSSSVGWRGEFDVFISLCKTCGLLILEGESLNKKEKKPECKSDVFIKGNSERLKQNETLQTEI